MEYLDPDKKRRRRQRIAIGYVVIGTAIAIFTAVFLAFGYGWGVDPENGEIVHNGIVFVDTKPVSSEVTVNGDSYGDTDLRLTLPSGDYRFQASADGYRPWSREVYVNGGQLRRLTYPILVPESLKSTNDVSLSVAPNRAMQTVDKERILTWHKSSPLVFDLIDISQSPAKISKLALVNSSEKASNIQTSVLDSASDLEIIDFGSADRYALLRFTVAGAPQFVLLDTEDPTLSVNLTALLPSSIAKTTEIEMKDRSRSEFYAYDSDQKRLYSAKLGSSNELPKLSLEDELPIQNEESAQKWQKVLDYRAHGKDWLWYITESGQKGLVDVVFDSGGESKTIKQVKTAKDYHLQLAKYDGYPVVAVGANTETRVFVYADPLKIAREATDPAYLPPTTELDIQDLQELNISSDSSVLMARSGDNIVTFEFNVNEKFSWQLPFKIKSSAMPHWISGQYLNFVDSSGYSWICDFDGSNCSKLTRSSNLGIFYNSSKNIYFTFDSIAADAEPSTKTGLNRVSLVAEQPAADTEDSTDSINNSTEN